MKKSNVISFMLGMGAGALCYKYKDEISDIAYAVGSTASDLLRPVIDAVVSGECPCSCCSQFAKEAKMIIAGEAPVKAVETDAASEDTQDDTLKEAEKVIEAEEEVVECAEKADAMTAEVSVDRTAETDNAE